MRMKRWKEGHEMTERGTPNSSEDSAALSACKEWSTYVLCILCMSG